MTRPLGVSAVFKMKRNKKDIAVLRESGDRKVSLGQMIAEAFPDEESLYRDEPAETQFQPDEGPTAQGSEPNSMTESAPASEGDSSACEQVICSETTGTSTAKVYDVNVIHPWNIVDYHLYLMCVEGGKDIHKRRNSMYLFDGADCRPFFYREFYKSNTFAPGTIGPETKLLFGILPLSEPGPSFNGMKYLLGFDLNEERIFVRRFSWLPDDVEDIWTVWDEGELIYLFSIPDLQRILRASFSNEDGAVNITRLSSSNYCLTKGTDEDPGMEMVIVIQCCQWVTDLAEIFWAGDDEVNIDGVKDELIYFMNKWRLVLQRASYRAWFALRDGMSRQAYTRKSSMDQVISDLYAFNKSKQCGNMRDGSWHVPTQDTCDRIRQRCWDQCREEAMERVQKKFERLFTPPDADSPLASPRKALEKILDRSAGVVTTTSFSSLEVPRTPSPSIIASEPCSSLSFTPCSEDIVASVAEQFETEHDGISLSAMLSSIASIVEQNPHLDIIDNRRRLGALMTDMGLPMTADHFDKDKRPLARQKHDSGYGCNEEEWGMELKAMEENEKSNYSNVRRAPRLLPSPILD